MDNSKKMFKTIHTVQNRKTPWASTLISVIHTIPAPTTTITKTKKTNSFYNKDPMKNIIDILKNNGIYNNELVTKLNNFNKNIQN